MFTWPGGEATLYQEAKARVWQGKSAVHVQRGERHLQPLHVQMDMEPTCVREASAEVQGGKRRNNDSRAVAALKNCRGKPVDCFK